MKNVIINEDLKKEIFDFIINNYSNAYWEAYSKIINTRMITRYFGLVISIIFTLAFMSYKKLLGFYLNGILIFISCVISLWIIIALIVTLWEISYKYIMKDKIHYKMSGLTIYYFLSKLNMYYTKDLIANMTSEELYDLAAEYEIERYNEIINERFKEELFDEK